MRIMLPKKNHNRKSPVFELRCSFAAADELDDKGRVWRWGRVTPWSVDTTRVSYLISCNPIEGYGFLLREVQRVEINSLQDY